MEVKRFVMSQNAFSDALKKVYKQEMKLLDTKRVLEFTENYEKQLKEIREIYTKFKEKEENKQELMAYLNESVLLPDLPECVLNFENVSFSPEELFFLKQAVPE